MRRAAKVDDNQKDLVKLLRRLGYSVEPSHMMGRGFPDLVLGQWGVNFLVEIKDSNKVPSKQALTEDQEEFHLGWKGQVDVLNSEDEVIKWDQKQRFKMGRITSVFE